MVGSLLIFISIILYLNLYSYINGLVQERRNSSGLAMELCLELTHRYVGTVFVAAVPVLFQETKS